MPFVYFLLYLIAESLAFYGVAKLIGTGWALVALGAVFIFGLLLASFELTAIAKKASTGQISPGRSMGDSGLVTVGVAGCVVPGFVTSVAGLLLIIPPTRALVRRSLARTLRKRLDEFGVRAVSRSRMMNTSGRPTNRYGTFTVEATDVHDEPVEHHPTREEEEALRKFSDSVQPEDFTGDEPGSAEAGGHTPGSNK
ncbi:FxsA family protein [Corynebacterium choanae]|uniref:FxsA family protein n=1 Tax=Corynebacterium choanae TaxID=1862358 RepID=UPI001FE3A6B7|nr:FxsA family protein [Corynebacterium choanae]